MHTIIPLFAQTQGSAIFVIIVLLLVAGTIGYITSWLYFKTLNKNRFNELEAKIEKLQNKIDSLIAENKNHVIEFTHAQLEIKALKALHTEAIHELDEMKLQNKKIEQSIWERNKALKNISQRKHMLNYASFGTAVEAEKDDLQMISGIGSFIEERLNAIDIFTFKQISKLTSGDIETINDIIEYFAGRIERDEWVAQAKELIQEENIRLAMLERIRANKPRIVYDRIGTASVTEADDLTEINGIGRWINKKLNLLEIYTFKQISNFTGEDIELVTELIEYFPGRIERDEWVKQAKEIVKNAGSKALLMKRISATKSRIYYDRLGIAHKHQANNLTRIKGISLRIEEQLNALDIFMFTQISKLTQEDISTITEILEIPVEKINRGNWVGQALELTKFKKTK